MTLAERIKEAIGERKAADVARATKKSPGAVTQWLDGTIKSIKGDTASALETLTGYRATWLVTGKGPKKIISDATDPDSGVGRPHGELPDYEMPTPTVEQAFQVLADLLANMNPLGQEMAAALLQNFAKAPDTHDRAAASLTALAAIQTRLPDPDPPPSRKSKAAASAPRRPADGKVKLTLKVGGGQKSQYDLPLRTVADPFNANQAPASERAWYSRVRAAPKANS